jgi:hypothetical protein
VVLEEEGELEDDDTDVPPDHKPGLRKRKDEDDDEEGGGGAGFDKASRNQMAMDAYNTLMSVLKSN